MILSLLLACTGAGPGSPDDDSRDTADVDLLCDTPSTWYVDSDGDGYGAGEPTGRSCTRPTGQVANADDCDDNDAEVKPGAIEVCDGVDNDCDGVADPDGAEGSLACFVDSDGDGYGDPDEELLACVCSDGRVADASDCDDTDPNTHPGAEEILYDGLDQDCLGLAGEYDRDGDGYDWDGAVGIEGADPTDCNDDDASVHPDTWDDCADEVDQDCDGVVDECGMSEYMEAGDAWLRVYRDPDPETDPARGEATMGESLVWAGDSDGDGSIEVVAPVVSDDGSGSMRYRLVELPRRSGGGDVEVGQLTLATWELPADTVNWTGSSSLPDAHVISGLDLDGDGVDDYLFHSLGANSDLSSSGAGLHGRVDLWSGPAVGALSMDEATTVEYSRSESVVFMGALELLVPPTDGKDWVVAAHVWPRRDDAEGSDHTAVVLLTMDQFSGASGLGDATTIETSGGYELEVNLEAADLDGDGARDLVAGAASYATGQPASRVWVFSGPIDNDLTLDDAALVIDGSAPDDAFGDSIAVLPDLDGDGYGGLLATDQPAGADLPAVYLYHLDRALASTQLTTSDASARIDSIDDMRPTVPYLPRMVGDIDADGTLELALPAYGYLDGVFGTRLYLLEPPGSGVVRFDEAESLLTGDEHIDPYAGFGISVLSGQDADGDTWPDLVVGEYYWDADPDAYHTPYGRLLVFRGEEGAL